jgi:hypothetical protein
MNAGVVKHLSKVLVVLVMIAIAWLGSVAVAKAESGRLPTRVWQVPMGDRTANVLLPDWSQISLGSMPPIAANVRLMAVLTLRRWGTISAAAGALA